MLKHRHEEQDPRDQKQAEQADEDIGSRIGWAVHLPWFLSVWHRRYAPTTGWDVTYSSDLILLLKSENRNFSLWLMVYKMFSNLTAQKSPAKEIN